MMPLSVYLSDMNITNITNFGWLRWSLQPFQDILGPILFPMIFLLPVMIIWNTIPSHKPMIVGGYVLGVGFIMWQLFDSNISRVFLLITVLILVPIFYYGLWKRGPNE